MRYEIVSIDSLIPLEQVFPTHLNNLEKMINSSGFMLKAIIADEKYGTILDGSHRYVYLLKNGFKTAPVYWVDYDDENIRVGSKLLHKFLIREKENIKISKKICRDRSLSGNLFPPRTTRHFFPFRKADITLPLKQLKKGKPIDVLHLIADVDVNEEIESNKGYIEEINEEYEVIIQYLSEVSQTKKYLEYQVLKMSNSKKVAFFPGKFQPPHIGHIQTIMNILPHYKKIIIGITEDRPDGINVTSNYIKNILNQFFKSFDHVEICKIKGVLTKKENLDGLPEFDVLLSGNEKVIKWGDKHNIESKYIPRSEGMFCSGTEIRSILGDKK